MNGRSQKVGDIAQIPVRCPSCKGLHGLHRRMGGTVCNGCRAWVWDNAGNPPIGAKWTVTLAEALERPVKRCEKLDRPGSGKGFYGEAEEPSTGGVRR